MIEAGPDAERLLVRFMRGWEPVKYLCVDGCGTQVSHAGGLCGACSKILYLAPQAGGPLTPQTDVCIECGNDYATQGYRLCMDCLEEFGDNL